MGCFSSTSLRSQSSNRNLTVRLDQLQDEIELVLHKLQAQPGISLTDVNGESNTVMRSNLEICLQSAGKLLKPSISSDSRRPSSILSESSSISEPLTVQQRRRIELWISEDVNIAESDEDLVSAGTRSAEETEQRRIVEKWIVEANILDDDANEKILNNLPLVLPASATETWPSSDIAGNATLESNIVEQVRSMAEEDVWKWYDRQAIIGRGVSGNVYKVYSSFIVSQL